MARKYLEEAGVKIDISIDPLGLSLDDDCKKQWEEEIEAYGFASPELWNLDKTMIYHLYERLYMWQEKGLFGDTRITTNGKDAPLEYWVNKIVGMCQDIFDSDNTLNPEKSAQTSKEVWNLWAEISPMMWV